MCPGAACKSWATRPTQRAKYPFGFVLVQNRRVAWQTHRMAATHDVLAPDGSEIRVLVQVQGGSMIHCTLQPGHVTQAVRHRTVDEVWFCVAGSGQVWRRSESEPDEIVDVEPGVALSIPLGVAFQFRAGGSQPLELVIATIPAWPGEDEALAVDGVWAAKTTR
jgi:mannose-6-phosphate isomerase-like protein (cupin superfamily)